MAGWPIDSLLGQTIDDNFEISGILGHGGFGAVYRATHRVLGGERALKVLRRDLVHDDALMERFWREAKALYQLNAPQLIKVEQYGRLDDGRPYMVMELAHGERLDRLVRQGGLFTPIRCIRVAREVLLALAEAHEHGVLHRDLKAENVMVDSDAVLGERVKVLDLGIARILGNLQRLTSETRTLGTPEYMSPEQWRGVDDLDGRSDLYAVGCLMYEMLTGDVPFPRHLAGPAAIYTMLCTTNPKPISETRKDLPASLEGFVFRLMARKRERRPATAMHALQELERIRAASS